MSEERGGSPDKSGLRVHISQSELRKELDGIYHAVIYGPFRIKVSAVNTQPQTYRDRGPVPLGGALRTNFCQIKNLSVVALAKMDH